MAKSKFDPTDPVLAELVAIKRLLVVALMRDGIKQRHIADVLGIHESQFSRSVPKSFAAVVQDSRSVRLSVERKRAD